MLSSIFIFSQILLITIFVEIYKYIAKFIKDSIFKTKIFKKLLCEILTKLSVRNTSYGYVMGISRVK